MENSATGPSDWVDAGPGVRRRIMGHVPEMMLVEVVFQSGAVGHIHSHPHTQASYIAEGRFEVSIDGATQILSVGDSFVVAPGLRHGVLALDAGRLIDSFAPRRDDFL